MQNYLNKMNKPSDLFAPYVVYTFDVPVFKVCATGRLRHDGAETKRHTTANQME